MEGLFDGYIAPEGTYDEMFVDTRTACGRRARG